MLAWSGHGFQKGQAPDLDGLATLLGSPEPGREHGVMTPCEGHSTALPLVLGL